MKKLSFVVTLFFLLTTSCQEQTEEVLASVETASSNYAVSVDEAQQLAHLIPVTEDASGRTEGKKIKNYKSLRTKNGVEAMHIFNYEDGGFLLMPADYRVAPVLAQVDKGEFKEDEMPDVVKMWLNESLENVEEAKKGKKQPRKVAIKAWIQYYKKAGLKTPNVLRTLFDEAVVTGKTVDNGRVDPDDPNCTTQTTTVGPLLQTTWGQGCDYNDLIPVATSDHLYCYKAATGCGATAVAQIMKYWEFPSGFDWSDMPDSSGTNSTAELMVSVGYNTHTIWNIDGNGASGTHNIQAFDDAFTFWFGYGSATHRNYTFSDVNFVTNDLDKSQPVIFGGLDWSELIGHVWVCDGYKKHIYPCWGTIILLRMNWGWRGDYDGWYSYNNWYISGKNQHYNQNKELIYNIHP